MKCKKWQIKLAELIEGKFGATYFFNGETNHLEITKKDGQRFFIPIPDLVKLSAYILRKKRISKISSMSDDEILEMI